MLVIAKTSQELSVRPGTVAQACNPSHLRSGDLEDCSAKPAQGKSQWDPISTSGWLQAYYPSYLWGSTNRRITDQTCPGVKQDPISKISSTKRAGEVTQVVEHLPSKHEAFSSNSNITKKRGISEHFWYMATSVSKLLFSWKLNKSKRRMKDKIQKSQVLV
jgi:hypothetical protein